MQVDQYEELWWIPHSWFQETKERKHTFAQETRTTKHNYTDYRCVSTSKVQTQNKHWNGTQNMDVTKTTEQHHPKLKSHTQKYQTQPKTFCVQQKHKSKAPIRDTPLLGVQSQTICTHSKAANLKHCPCS